MVHEGGEAVGGVVGVVGGAVASRVGGGGLDELIEGVGEGGGLVDGVAGVCLKADLSAKGPSGLDPGVVRKGAEEGMVGGSEVLIDGVFGANSVGGKISGGGKGIAFVLEDEAADELRIKLDNDGAR